MEPEISMLVRRYIRDGGDVPFLPDGVLCNTCEIDLVWVMAICEYSDGREDEDYVPHLYCRRCGEYFTTEGALL